MYDRPQNSKSRSVGGYSIYSRERLWYRSISGRPGVTVADGDEAPYIITRDLITHLLLVDTTPSAPYVPFLSSGRERSGQICSTWYSNTTLDRLSPDQDMNERLGASQRRQASSLDSIRVRPRQRSITYLKYRSSVPQGSSPCVRASHLTAGADGPDDLALNGVYFQSLRCRGRGMFRGGRQ